MATSPDLSLPETVPEMERCHEQPLQILHYALHTLCRLDDEKLKQYRSVCATDLDDDGALA